MAQRVETAVHNASATTCRKCSSGRTTVLARGRAGCSHQGLSGDNIYVREVVDGEWDSCALSELPAKMAMRHAIDDDVPEHGSAPL